MAMARITLSDDASFDHLERGKQGRGAVPFVVMGEGAASSGFKRQPRLGAIQGLNLTLLVYTKHHGILRWREIDADHIRELLHEFGVTRELKTFAQVRLALMLLPNPRNRVFADALGRSQFACTQMRGTGRFGLQGGFHNGRSFAGPIPGFASPARAHLPHTTDTEFAHPLSPEGNRASLHAQIPGDTQIGLALSRRDDDPRPSNYLL